MSFSTRDSCMQSNGNPNGDPYDTKTYHPTHPELVFQGNLICQAFVYTYLLKYSDSPLFVSKMEKQPINF